MLEWCHKPTALLRCDPDTNNLVREVESLEEPLLVLLRGPARVLRQLLNFFSDKRQLNPAVNRCASNRHLELFNVQQGGQQA